MTGHYSFIMIKHMYVQNILNIIDTNYLYFSSDRVITGTCQEQTIM